MCESDNEVVEYGGGKVDEMAIVDYISGYLTEELQNFYYSSEVVRQIMASITEAVVEKCTEQKKLPFAGETKSNGISAVCPGLNFPNGCEGCDARKPRRRLSKKL